MKAGSATVSFTTKDDVTVSITYAYYWEIVDIKKIVLGVEKREALSVQNVQLALYRWVTRSAWADLKDPQLEMKVLKSARRLAAESGVKLNAGGITELSKVKPIRLIGDVQTELSE